MPARTRFIEISHSIEAGMETYRGLPVPTVEVIVDYESSRPRYGGQSEFLIASLHLCGNTGTYVDSPRHRFAEGVDLASLPLERLADLDVVVVDARRSGRGIAPDVFRDTAVRDKAVLVHTGFARHWRTEAYFRDNPFLTSGGRSSRASSPRRKAESSSLKVNVPWRVCWVSETASRVGGGGADPLWALSVLPAGWEPA